MLKEDSLFHFIIILQHPTVGIFTAHYDCTCMYLKISEAPTLKSCWRNKSQAVLCHSEVLCVGGHRTRAQGIALLTPVAITSIHEPVTVSHSNSTCEGVPRNEDRNCSISLRSL